MPRKAQIRYFPSRNGYFYRPSGSTKDVRLATGLDDFPNGPTYTEAHEAFGRLLRAEASDSEAERSAFWTLADKFIDYLRDTKKGATTVEIRTKFLKSFSKATLALEVGRLTQQTVLDWLRDNPAWQGSTRYMAVSSVRAVLNWARKTGRITRNPIPPFTAGDMPSAQSRGVEAVISLEARGALLGYVARVTPWYRDAVTFLDLTGCRPSEMRLTEARFVNLSTRQIILPRELTKTRKKARVIVFDRPELVEMLVRLCAAHPVGPLFRTKEGHAWTLDTLGQAFNRISKRIGHSVQPYSFRHTYCTDWLASGRSAAHLATLVGTSIKMLEKHYGHLEIHLARLGEIAGGFRSGGLREQVQEMVRRASEADLVVVRDILSPR